MLQILPEAGQEDYTSGQLTAILPTAESECMEPEQEIVQHLIVFTWVLATILMQQRMAFLSGKTEPPR